jgi:protein involved in polysaccharide export with SLBB domain
MKRVSSIAIIAIVLASAAFGQSPSAAQSQVPPGSMLANTAAPSASDAPIGPRDFIEVKVFQDPNLYTKMTVTDAE